MDYTQMTKEELTRQYSSMNWTTRLPKDELFPAYMAMATKVSAENKEKYPCRLAVPYGPTDGQKYDIYGVDNLPNDAPILLHIHGGYWQKLSRESSSYVVEPFYQRGSIVVVAGYDLSPVVTVKDIIEELRSLFRVVLKLACERGSRGVYLSGHSAGGHLVAMCLSTPDLTDKQRDIIKGAVPLSGVYDLRPLVQTPVNDGLHLTEETAWEVSANRTYADIPKLCPHVEVLVRVGEHESPESKRQSREFFETLDGAGMKCSYQEVPGTDHFSVVEDLRLSGFSLTKEMLKLMKLES